MTVNANQSTGTEGKSTVRSPEATTKRPPEVKTTVRAGGTQVNNQSLRKQK
jgi:hypothetical protein